MTGFESGVGGALAKEIPMFLEWGWDVGLEEVFGKMAGCGIWGFFEKFWR